MIGGKSDFENSVACASWLRATLSSQLILFLFNVCLKDEGLGRETAVCSTHEVTDT